MAGHQCGIRFIGAGKSESGRRAMDDIAQERRDIHCGVSWSRSATVQ